MRKILWVVFIIVVCGCSKYDVEYEIYNEFSYVYVLDKNNEYIKVAVDYEINDLEDIFNLYTKYQNILPMDNFCHIHPNIELIKYQIKENNILYSVNNFIFINTDIIIFKQLLSKTNKLYGYGDPLFLFNGVEV